MLDNDTDTTSSEGSRSPSPEPEPEPGYVPNLRLLQGLPYKELQSEISRSRVPEDFNPIYPRLTRAIHLVVFNCHPTNQAGEESKAPSDWPCIWPEPDPFSGLATNKLLETWGEHEIGLSAATWLERNARSKKEHTDRTICLSHDAVLAHLTVKLGLLNCPDIRIPRDEQWQIVNWFTTADPVTGIPSAFPPILLSNLFKAVAGGALLAGGAQALQAWLTPYFERFYLHASHADAQFCTDQSDRDLPGDYRFPDRVMELAQFIPMVYRICRTQQVPLRHQGRFLNQAVAAIWQANGLRMRFTSERTLIPTYAQFTECGLRLLRRIIFTAAMSDKSYLWLEKGGETLVPYINEMTALITSPVVLGILAIKQGLKKYAHFGSSSASFNKISVVTIASFGCYHWLYRHDLDLLEAYVCRLVEAAELVLRPMLEQQIALQRAER